MDRNEYDMRIANVKQRASDIEIRGQEQRELHSGFVGYCHPERVKNRIKSFAELGGLAVELIRITPFPGRIERSPEE